MERSLKKRVEEGKIHFHSDRLGAATTATAISCTQILRFQPHLLSDMDMGERAERGEAGDGDERRHHIWMERVRSLDRSSEVVVAAAAAAYYIAQFRASSPSLGSPLFAVEEK